MKKNVKNNNKKLRTLILFLLIIGILLVPFYSKAEEIYPQNGDLRCPGGKSVTDKCVMYNSKGDIVENADSTVNKVVVTYKNKDVKVTKTVQIIDKPNGIYKVWFNFDGEINKTILNSERVNIVVIRDVSQSMSGDAVQNSKNAITKFSVGTNENKFYLGLIQFAQNSVITRRLEKTFLPDSTYYYDKPGGQLGGNLSNVYKAFNQAHDMLNNKKGENYIVLISDGRYWLCPNDVDKDHPWYSDDVQNSLTDLEQLAKIYVIHYRASFRKNEVLWDQANLPSFCEKKKDTYGECDNKIIKRIGESGKIWWDTGDSNYEKVLNEILKDIAEKQKTTVTEQVKFKITDTIGNTFTLSGSGKSEFKITNKNEGEKNAFYIQINKEFAKNGWKNQTNEEFTIEYTIDDEEEQTIKKSRQPQVYWKNNQPWSSCSDSVTISKDSKSDDSYFNISCTQTGNADVTTDNQPLKTKLISIERGKGFPIELKVNSSVNCTYDFDHEKFMSDYSFEIQKIENEKNAKLAENSAKLNKENLTDVEKNNLNRERVEINNSAKTAIEKINTRFKNTLQIYVDAVTNATYLKSIKEKSNNGKAYLGVNYFEVKNSDGSMSTASGKHNFVNSEIDSSNPSCVEDSNSKNIELLDIKIKSKYNCSANLNKTMVLENVCISMTDSEVEKCKANSKVQLNGGNMFYPDLDFPGGYIYVELKNLYLGTGKIILDGEDVDDESENPNCQFSLFDSNNNSQIIFRQIELADPFIKTYTNMQRKIGNNWLNNNKKYDFTKIIDSNIWANSDNYEYKYTISKSDANKIVKNNSEEGVSSYLGRDCKFNSKNQWVCSFIRYENGTSGNKFFTNIKINETK